MSAIVEPEPPASEREAILTALGAAVRAAPGGWAEAALAEGVEGFEGVEVDP